MSALQGPFGVPYDPENPRTTMETIAEYVARAPYNDYIFRPIHHDWGNPDCRTEPDLIRELITMMETPLKEDDGESKVEATADLAGTQYNSGRH